MKTVVITAVAALALGLGGGVALAGGAIDKSAMRRAPDGVVQGEEDRGRRWMRSWRDELDGETGQAERNWSDRLSARGKSGDSDDGSPAESGWRESDGEDRRPPKPRG